MKIFIILVCVLSFFLILVFNNVFNSKLRKQYEKKHEYYRTLWYRTDQNCFYDSCKKYGHLYDSIVGNEVMVIDVDTVTVKDNPACK